MKIVALLRVCAFTLASIVSVSAQGNPYPNEVPGFEFFGKGKLAAIKLGESKRLDVEHIFGNACEEDCVFDDRFSIKFDYLSCDDCMTTEYVRDRMMCPLREYIGTIQKVTPVPRVPVQFDKVSTARFSKRTGGVISQTGSFSGVSYESFGDEFGLKYSIKRGDTSSLTLTTPGSTNMSGPLYSIEYGLSVDVETRIFKAEYKTCSGKVE